jgi:lipopolysaccharide assembly outer membrane protein LptD (OstA)
MPNYNYFVACVTVILTMLFSNSLAQVQQPIVAKDSVAIDSTKKAQPSKPLLNSEVTYAAADSIIFSLEGDKVFLYNEAKVTYEDIELTAWFIELDLAKNEAYACGTRDSLNKEVGLPVFKDKSGEYTMRTMHYNFETRKAKIEHVVTEQGEGYVVAENAKKSANNEFCLKDGIYTTCDNHEHPHFGLVMTKAKVIPGKKTVTGPAYLVMEDVPFPLVIPFGFVPTTKKYSSGFIMPTYGEESSRGFFLRNGGYYFAASDYFDYQVTGDIYTNGSWGLHTGSQYRMRYKFSGNFNLQYLVNITSEKDLPDYAKSKDFSINWTHRQDTKANPYQNFSASVNFSTSSFDQNNVGNIVDPVALATNTKRSSISYSKRWPTGPFNLSANFLHSQNSSDSTIDLTLPDLTLTMNRIFPFKSKNRVGSEEAWFEKICFSYSANMKNYISTKESELMSSKLNEDWKNGIKHSIPVSMNLKFLKYFTASPSINYTERWYTTSIEQGYNEELQQVVNTDTLNGFFRVYDYGYSVGTSTKLYTFYKPWRSVFGDKITAIRHVMTPSVSLNYRPDFSEAKYGFYDKFEYYNEKTNEVVKYEYSKYKDGIYGSPGSGKSGSMGFSLGNSLEMKMKSDKDTTGFKKVKLIESLSFSSGYNFLADSLKFSRVSMSGRTKIFKTDVSFGATFDPYAMDTSKAGNPIRVNKPYADGTNIPLRLENANMSFGMSFNNEQFKKKKDANAKPEDGTTAPTNEQLPPEDPENPQKDQPLNSTAKPMDVDEDGYVGFKMPWTMSFNYNMRVAQGTFNKTLMDYNKEITADLTFNGTLSPTPKWNISFSSGYSFHTQKLAHTNFNVRRDLHCWSMSFNLVPTGKYKSYFFTISANSSMLQDLKYEKRNSYRDNGSYY